MPKKKLNFEESLARLEEILDALRIAQAEDFVAALPEGLDTVLATGGTNLSGGQRHRLLISRAIAGKPEILVLDDSSSALDYKTDANLRRALSTALPDSTVITVAQRVSSVKSCDLILVIEDGEIIGSVMRVNTRRRDVPSTLAAL